MRRAESPITPASATSDDAARVDPTPYGNLSGRYHDRWVQRVLLAVLGIVVFAASLDVFGQRPATTRAAGARASLSVQAARLVRADVGQLDRAEQFRTEALAFRRVRG